jgi:hypothetical protein
MRPLVPLLLLLSFPPLSLPAERVDNVLAQLIPVDTQALFGARMEQVKTTPLFIRLIGQQKLPQLDSFSSDTGFDPRRDVRDLLLASSGRPNSGVLLARGTFHVSLEKVDAKALKTVGYRGYVLTLTGKEDAGFCIMDRSLAIAGPTASMKAALDHYLSSTKNESTPLLEQARAVPQQFQVWSVSTGAADFLANNLPHEGNAANFGKIFRSMENTHFQADLSHGLNAMAQGMCRTDADAKSLADAVRGLIGFGRLSVPDNQPELLRLWDGLKIDQNQRSLTITANIPQELVDKLAQFFQSNVPSGGTRLPHPHGPKRDHEGVREKNPHLP